MMTTKLALYLALSFLYHINGQLVVLNSSFSQDTTLTLSESPYEINQHTTIHPAVSLSIENGVEIVFSGANDDDYLLCDNCILNIGCDLMANGVNTTKYNNRGLATTTTYSYIHSSNNTVRKGYIRITGEDAVVSFCNVKFEGLLYGIYYEVLEMKQAIIVDNCEFTDIHEVGHGESWDTVDHQLSDSWFHHNINMLYARGRFEFRNCLIESFETFSSDYVIIVHNSILMDMVNVCIDNGYQTGPITNNIIKNCTYGMKTGTNRYTNNGPIMYNLMLTIMLQFK